MMMKSGLEKKLFEISPCEKMVIFVTEFVIWGKTFHEVSENNFLHGGISK